eukprot:CAMPEP_0114449902 /NCGR_PEP_ID=MMETSP0104-20121206/178_1 /TAXON_ID=37642 ORGANISM="Paraphysomonas imperforata, Strain PA2" /NCGR_SAMPLE_ID=MMETSP0104 /ASSEMBLY_ACC=CAM_ASM_000202 /LENGTH=484 /DNA_ID=CAMNT_0001622015 /DNA_START=535 /DNA_END=1989 /DNA_ORIENTATION=+
MTLKYVVIVIDSSIAFEEGKSILAKKEAIVDVFNGEDFKFAPAPADLVDGFKIFLRKSTEELAVCSASSFQELTLWHRERQHFFETGNALTDPLPIGIIIYFKSLEMSGSNMRLARFGCFACSRHVHEVLVVSVLVDGVDASGPVLDFLHLCKCPLNFLYLLNDETSGFDIGYLNVNATFLKYLYDATFLLVPNTHGDFQTHRLFQLVQQHRPPSLFVVLDLCNNYVFSEEYDTLWRHVIDGLVSPSVHMTQNRLTSLSGKLVETVYPSCGYRDENIPLNIAPWPRRRNGRFQVGYFGRLTAERSPGLFVRIVAHLLNGSQREAAYIRQHIEFVVAGSGAQMLMLQELARHLGVLDDINFLGYINDLSDYLCQTDLVVNTMARGENFGVMQAEAMVCGTPVLAFNSSASQESLHPRASHLITVSSASISLMGQAIVSALEEPQRQFNWSDEGLATASVDTYHVLAPGVQAKHMINALKRLNKYL